MSWKLGIVGASGVVGQEAWKLASEFLGNDGDVFAFASSARTLENGQKVLSLEESSELLQECDWIINAASSELGHHLRERLGPHQYLVDNSSAFRMDADVPLVVPEVNGDLLQDYKGNIIANPNCTAAILCVALAALKPWSIRRVIVSTYQAASGAGIAGLNELSEQLKLIAEDGANAEALEKLETPVFGELLAANVLSHNSASRSNPDEPGYLYNDEEYKVVQETCKILGDETLEVSATCARVPVIRAHTESVSVDLDQELSLEELRNAFAHAPGVKVVDDFLKGSFPSPRKAQNQDLVLVGRIRQDIRRTKTWHFFIAGDQLRKGAASNALQICQLLLKNSLLKNSSSEPS